jgi:NAD(P)-dependent dehydrogenase (short-subunit alcohol dehydrogenase family)
LQQDADVRIITLTSNANTVMIPPGYRFQFTSPSFLTKPVSYYPWQWRYLSRHIFIVDMIRYSLSKTANLLFAQELQRRMDEQQLPILSMGVHPGGVASDGAVAIGGWLFQVIARWTFLTIDQGAITSLFAATSKEVRKHSEKYKGQYLEPFGKVGVSHSVVHDKKQRMGLWSNTTSEVNKHLSKIGLPLLQDW